MLAKTKILKPLMRHQHKICRGKGLGKGSKVKKEEEKTNKF